MRFPRRPSDSRHRCSRCFFGLVVTWFDYRLNLDLDLDRHLVEMRDPRDGIADALQR
jgi:hypothetical protein